MKKYLVHSTLIAVFSESLRIHTSSVDLKFFYLIILVNFLIIISLNKKIFFPKNLFIFLFFLFLSSIYTFIYHNSLKGYLQIVGISICSLYFLNFFKYVGSNKLKEIFKSYLKYVFLVCVIGLIIYPIKKYFLGFSNYRLSSVLGEPAHFSAIVLPGFYYYLKNYKNFKFKTGLIFLTLILSASSLAYIGIALAILLQAKGNRAFRNISLAILVAILGYSSYLVVPQIKIRVDDTLSSLVSYDVEGVNLSTYALISNLHVTKESFIRNPIFGGGLGSHPSNHEKYINGLEGFNFFKNARNGLHSKLNAEDANSLLLRVVSELGLFGVYFVLLFIKRHYTTYGIGGNMLSRSMLIYFFYKLLREGNYFPPEMYFFVGLYYFNSKQEKLLLYNDTK